MGEVVNLWVKREERKRAAGPLPWGLVLVCVCGCDVFEVHDAGGAVVITCPLCNDRAMTLWGV